MPGIHITHSHALRCPKCSEHLGEAGSYSALTTENGEILLFNDADPPVKLSIALVCSNKHVLKVPKEFKVDWWFATPKTAVEGCSAVAVSAVTKSGKTLDVGKRLDKPPG